MKHTLRGAAIVCAVSLFFTACTGSLSAVTIPNSVTTIGLGAFNNNQLTRVTIGNRITAIGEYAFAENQLTNVTIGNSVTIGARVDLEDKDNSYAFDNGYFADTYYENRRAAETYTRANAESTMYYRFCTNILVSIM